MPLGRNHGEFDIPSAATEAILSTRQFLHARFGLPLAGLGGVVLVVGLVQELQFEQIPAICIAAAAVVIAVAAIVMGELRARRLGLWARPAGDPSLAAPSDRHVADPTTTARIQLGAVVILGALVAGACFYGATVDTVTFWIIAYGIVHMAVYCASLATNLQMREQFLPLAWFVLGGLYWLKTGHSIAVLFGGGWLLGGLLLYLRLRQFEKLTRLQATDDCSKEGAP
jgi:hypothetical protein